jgi:hypothetical protein
MKEKFKNLCFQINQDQLWKLFDIIPGLDYCQINGDYGRSGNAAYATVVYSNLQSASYARLFP